MHFEDFRYPANYRDRWIPLAPFDPANVPHVDPRAGGKLLLRQAFRLSQPPDVLANDSLPLHDCMKGEQERERLGTIVPNGLVRRLRYYSSYGWRRNPHRICETGG